MDSGPHSHLSLNRDGLWGTTDNFTTSFLHISLFSTALWNLANSRPVHSLMLSSHLFLYLPCHLYPFSVSQTSLYESLYEMRSILWEHLISMAHILFCSFAVRVYDSQAYRKMNVTRKQISHILELRELLLSF